jgi:hypothetical protein
VGRVWGRGLVVATAGVGGATTTTTTTTPAARRRSIARAAGVDAAGLRGLTGREGARS